MKNYREIRSNEDIYQAKLEDRKRSASQPFEKKLITVIQLQIRACAMAEAAGRSCPKPWHFDDRKRMKAYSKSK